jgi:biotin transporter BioY
MQRSVVSVVVDFMFILSAGVIWHRLMLTMSSSDAFLCMHHKFINMSKRG